MALVLDTGPIIAFLDRDEPRHAATRRLFAREPERLVVPAAVLPEVDYFVCRDLGARVWREFVRDIHRGAYHVHDPSPDELLRAAELEVQYADLELGFVDAAVIATCEALGETRVATLDHRHFSAVQPAHCERLTLLPE